MQYPINEMFQTLQGEGYFTGVPAIFIRLQDAWLAVPGATPNTPGKSLRIGKSPFSAFWRRPKRVISGGLRAVKICWLSLVARDTPRGMW